MYNISPVAVSLFSTIPAVPCFRLLLLAQRSNTRHIYIEHIGFFALYQRRKRTGTHASGKASARRTQRGEFITRGLDDRRYVRMRGPAIDDEETWDDQRSLFL
jgi:hypothetical protein